MMTYEHAILTLCGISWVSLAPAYSHAQGSILPPKVKFVEVSREAGIDGFHHVAGGAKKEYIIESKGGGVAILDYDGDDWLDIFLVSGATFEDLQGPPGTIPLRNKLFRNNRDGTFTEVTSQVGIKDAGWGMGASAADYDNDGHTDLYLTYFGRNVLYHNNGNGTFSDVTSKSNLGVEGWSTGAAWGDYDRDGDLDLYVARYIDFVREDVPRRGDSLYCKYKNVPVFCGPRGLKPLGDVVFRNEGYGTFTNVTTQALGPDPPCYYGFTPLWFDMDNDGWVDVFVTNDGTPNLLYHNRGDGTFEETGAVAGCAYSADGLEQSSMGADFGDFNRDGLIDIFMTAFADDYNTLYRNTGKGFFSDVTVSAGLHSVSWNMVSWGTKFFDMDLDGWLDLFIANGHVYPEADQWGMESGFRQHPQVLRNKRDGRFEDVTAALGSDLLRKGLGRGIAVGDLDNDGDLDVVVTHLDGPPSLFRCDSSPDAQWILIELEGARSNRDALGARILVRAAGLEQMHEVHRSGGFCSSNDPRAHFGLRNAGVVDELEIRWPSGLIQTFKGVKSRQILRIKEGETTLHSGPVGMTGLRH